MDLLTTPFPDTRPYPWPYDGHLELASTALVLCGWQAAFCDVGDPAAGDVAVRLADDWSAAGGSVIALAHTTVSRRPVWLPAPNDPGAAILPVPDGALMLTALGWDGCHGSPLEARLRALGLTHVLLAGHAAEATVDSTVRTLNDRGFECLVLTDASTAIDPALLAHAQHSLTMSGGIFGALGTAADVQAALSRLRSLAAS